MSDMEDEKAPQQKLFLDEKNFFAEFLFKPEINDEADYSHIDKNLSVTRLASRWKEPERARSILRALHILNNNKYFSEQIIDESTGDYNTITLYQYTCPVCNNTRYSEENHEGVVCCDANTPIEPVSVEKTVPVTKKKLKTISMFPRTYHNLKAMFYAFTTTSMARDGHLMRSATTTNISKSESVEDRTKVRGTPFFGGNKNNNERY